MAKKINRITDIGKVIQSIFADAAASIRVAEAGLDLSPIGALGSRVRIGPSQPILVYNSGAIGYIKFGDQTVTAPVNATDGIPVLAGQVFMLNSGSNEWVIASAGTLFGYLADKG
jgi:hypothetical protein